VIDHEPSQRAAIDQDDFAVYRRGKLNSFTGEAGGCYERSLAGTMTLEGAGELLDFRAPYYRVPALRLQIDDIKPEPVLFDNPVDSTVTAPTNRLPGILHCPAVAHLDEQLDNETLEEWRRARLCLVEEISLKFCP